MPLRLTPLEFLLSRFNVLPTPLLDALLAPGIAKVLVAACEIGIFHALDECALSNEQLAEKLVCDPQRLQLLLQPLVSSDYLRIKNGYYYNTRITQRWLTTHSPYSIAPYIIHSPDIVALWDYLPEVVRDNKAPIRMQYTDDSPQTQLFLARHYAGLASLATALGRELVFRVRLPLNARRLLDVGGSHAAYSALFCQKYPYLHATVMDIHMGIEAGKRTAKMMKLEDRLDFVCLDIVQDDFSQTYEGQFDVALYFHIAHLLSPEENQCVLAKVVRTLHVGGMLIFVDQVTDQTHGSRLASLMVQFMTLSVTMIGGTCYPFDTVKNWLEHLGLGKVRTYRLVTPGVSMVTAIKSAV